MNETTTPVTPQPAAAVPSGSDKIWAMLCHLALFSAIGFLLFPLVVFLAMKNDSPFVAEHSREALNFHISIFIYSLAAGVLCVIGIGFFLLAAIGLATLILAIMAALKVSDNKPFRYPLTIRLVS